MKLTTGLLLLFIALKLTGIIDWSWIWVLAPFWIPFLIAIAIILFFGVKVIKKQNKKRFF